MVVVVVVVVVVVILVVVALGCGCCIGLWLLHWVVVVALGFKSVPKVLLVDFLSIYKKKKHLELETYMRLELPCLLESRCPFIVLQIPA